MSWDLLLNSNSLDRNQRGKHYDVSNLLIFYHCLTTFENSYSKLSQSGDWFLSSDKSLSNLVLGKGEEDYIFLQFYSHSPPCSAALKFFSYKFSGSKQKFSSLFQFLMSGAHRSTVSVWVVSIEFATLSLSYKQ